MKLFKKKRLVDVYKVVPSKEPVNDKTHIVLHETKTLRGCNYQRVFKGTKEECLEEQERLTKNKRMLAKEG